MLSPGLGTDDAQQCLFMGTPPRFAFRLPWFGRAEPAQISDFEGRAGPSRGRLAAQIREYLEVLAVIAAITVVGWFAPLGYRSFGHVYLFGVILLCLRVGRWPVLFSAGVSALAWNYVIMPPRFSFSVLHVEDALILSTYFVAALTAGLLLAEVRAQEKMRRQGERRATALFHLTRAFAAARSLDDASASALAQADVLFQAETALLLADPSDLLVSCPVGSYRIGPEELRLAEIARAGGHPIGRSTAEHGEAGALYCPLRSHGRVLGVLVLGPMTGRSMAVLDHPLLEAFAGQIALFIERERFRAAGEREKLLTESNRLRRTLLDCVSHELKTPLAVLRTATEGMDPDDRDRMAVLIPEVRTATRRLDRLVANLLNQNRLESGAVKPNIEPCDVRDIVASARRNVAAALEGRSLAIQLPPDLPLILADAPLLEQAMANLLLNAALYTPPGTPITVSAGVDSTRGKRVYVAVADRGPGLPAEMRRVVFGKFRRGKDAPPGGLGLGLSVVHGFVTAQHGEVVADDNPGGGARFTMYLPSAAFDPIPAE